MNYKKANYANATGLIERALRQLPQGSDEWKARVLNDVKKKKEG